MPPAAKSGYQRSCFTNISFCFIAMRKSMRPKGSCAIPDLRPLYCGADADSTPFPPPSARRVERAADPYPAERASIRLSGPYSAGPPSLSPPPQFFST
jgi:hypothetical protein